MLGIHHLFESYLSIVISWFDLMFSSSQDIKTSLYAYLKTEHPPKLESLSIENLAV